MHEYCIEILSATQKFESLSVMIKSVAAQLGQMFIQDFGFVVQIVTIKFIFFLILILVFELLNYSVPAF
jgi:hypothetical protein